MDMPPKFALRPLVMLSAMHYISTFLKFLNPLELLAIIKAFHT